MTTVITVGSTKISSVSTATTPHGAEHALAQHQRREGASGQMAEKLEEAKEAAEAQVTESPLRVGAD